MPLLSCKALAYSKVMSHVRRIITLFFAMVFLLSGMANANARARMAGARSIEICAELGYTNVILGVNGEKLPNLHDCSSCCIAVGMLQGAAPYVARRSMADMATWRGFDLALNHGDDVFSIWPRGPPIKL